MGEITVTYFLIHSVHTLQKVNRLMRGEKKKIKGEVGDKGMQQSPREKRKEQRESFCFTSLVSNVSGFSKMKF